MKDKLRTNLSAIKAYVKKNPHIWLVLYVPVYLAAFFAAESMIVDNYYVSYMPLDDKIPFIEYFVVPYYLWFPFLFIPGLYLLIRDAESFKRYMYFLIIGFTVSITFCILFPNGQNLRPEVFPRDNIFSRLVSYIYSIDTNTNVIPSMHVVGSFAVLSGILHSPAIKSRALKLGAIILTLLIAASTVLIKQHSLLDIIAAVILCIPIYFIIYGRDILQAVTAKRSQGLHRAE